MVEKGSNEQEIQRWPARPKAAVVLEVLRQEITGVDACRKYGIRQSEFEAWTARFLHQALPLERPPRERVARHAFG
ncbi:MAG: DUF1153 domain-containing protein [Candidatus Dadabacteria bacterium]|nr:MAG: DUF1153 domain-containing protein [Candidatus Dadabacteria bacterium]